MREMFRLSVSDIALASGEPLPKSDLIVTRAGTLANIHANAILFSKKLTADNIAALKKARECLILIPHDAPVGIEAEIGNSNVIARVNNPRLSFAKVMTVAISTVATTHEYTNRNGAFIATDTIIGEGTTIEPGVFIDHSVTIGANVRIHAGAVIRAFTHIGDNTIIRENAIIGSEGFGFERDDEGVPIRLPHLGGVQIGRNVEIGLCNSICAGTIDPTVIEDNVKVDSLVHIAHNCFIGAGTLITACAEISGSVKVGQQVWIAPNVSIIESKQIGDGATIGIGAVVIKNVEPGAVVAGSPARPTAEISKMNRVLSRLLAQEDAHGS